MPAANKKNKIGTTNALPVLQHNAAGIDIGATEIYVGVPHDRDPRPVRAFATFTQDLHALADWLGKCGVRTVAMESTGVYWIPLYQILESRGIEVCLVNARHVKNVPGRKSDVCDCQWLQYLHACGLLRASFRPKEDVCALRSLLRHRDTHITNAAAQVQRMQKSLALMNVHLHNVISDITGKTGLAILDAVLAGERDPHKLAQLRDYRIRASSDIIVKSLEGDWREEHLFTLEQCLSLYRTYQKMMHECDVKIERLMKRFESEPEQSQTCDAPAPKAPRGNDVRFEQGSLSAELHRILGTDLTRIPGIDSGIAHHLFTEMGADLSAFPSARHFSSWLGLCPDNRISGGRVLSVKTREVKSRVATALRMAAQSLCHSKCALGDFYRRMRSKLGAPKAITATAHKLARIVYHLLTTHESYNESIFAESDAISQQRRLLRLQRDATALGFKLTPRESVS